MRGRGRSRRGAFSRGEGALIGALEVLVRSPYVPFDKLTAQKRSGPMKRSRHMRPPEAFTRDAAPTEAGAVPYTSSPSDQACIFSTCWPRSSLDRNFPSGMGDRRVGTWMPCEVRRFVGQDYA